MKTKIATLEQLAVDHGGRCSTEYYHSCDTAMSLATWQDFQYEWSDCKDYYLFFRWDIKKHTHDGYRMELFVMDQRRGIFTPVTIQSVKDEDVPQIIEFLQPRFEYLKKLWEPFI